MKEGEGEEEGQPGSARGCRGWGSAHVPTAGPRRQPGPQTGGQAMIIKDHASGYSKDLTSVQPLTLKSPSDLGLLSICSETAEGGWCRQRLCFRLRVGGQWGGELESEPTARLVQPQAPACLPTSGLNPASRSFSPFLPLGFAGPLTVWAVGLPFDCPLQHHL